MATTFRSGPRDPRTGATSTVISPGNIVRADGRTDNERSQMASQFTADPGQEQQYQQAERDYQEFLQSSGRSNTNPYGDAGLFGARANLSNIMTPRQIEDVNRLAYNQYLGLASGRGTQRGGIGDFIPGYAPALKIGSNTPKGRVVAAPTQPKQSGIFSLSPTLGMLQALFGRGNILRTLDDGGVDYSTGGIEGLMEQATSLEPGIPNNGIALAAARPKFSLPPNYRAETDAEFEARMDRMYGEQYERDRERMLNQAKRDLYFQNQPDVGVFTPPPEPRPSYKSQTLLTDRREVMPEQYGGFADPLVGGTLSDMLDRRAQEQRLKNSPLPNTFSPRRMALQALLSGRSFQEI